MIIATAGDQSLLDMIFLSISAMSTTGYIPAEFSGTSLNTISVAMILIMANHRRWQQYKHQWGHETITVDGTYRVG